MKRDYVFVVIHGKRSEGGSLIDLFRIRTDAIECALNQLVGDSTGWKKPTRGIDYWESGNYFVHVIKSPIK